MPLTRRIFLAGAATLSVAARLDASIVLPMKKPRVIVVGSGGWGSWSALQLQRRGADVTLIDAWGAGNTRSSSGGQTRVIRAIYGTDRIYVEMVRRAYELWEELQRSRSESIYVETGALWLHRGDDGYVRSAMPSMKELGFPLEQLTLDDAAKRFPQISLRGVTSVWMEHRAGALSARDSCAVVAEEFAKRGGRRVIAQVEKVEIEKDRVAGIVARDGTRFEADAFVFACGPWLGRLFPDVIGERVRPTRQEVFYFGVPAGSNRYAPPQMPIWIDFGERIFYGIPDVHGRGFKVADDTRGEAFDPTNGDRTPSAAATERARALLAERFPELTRAPLLAAEVCQYENSPDGHLIIDRHPAAQNTWIAGGGSGHGFKLSPAVGEYVARAVLEDVAPPSLFALSRLEKLEKTSTQFERKG